MLTHDAKQWLRSMTILVRRIGYLRRFSKDEMVSVEHLKETTPVLDMVISQCREIGLTTSVRMANEARYVFDNRQEGLALGLVDQELEGIVNAIANELQAHTFLRIPSEYAKFYSEERAFGREVAEAFPGANKDIENGAKALACGLGTATVFHMMRVMELGLRSLGKRLGIPYAPSWESYIRQIEAKITAKHSSKSAKWKKEEPFFRDVLGDLQAIKIAWRNPTMHIVRHYDQEEGEDVFRAVRRFMRRIVDNGISQV